MQSTFHIATESETLNNVVINKEVFNEMLKKSAIFNRDVIEIFKGINAYELFMNKSFRIFKNGEHYDIYSLKGSDYTHSSWVALIRALTCFVDRNFHIILV